MARRPDNFAWIGFTPEQVERLDALDFIGNNAWARNRQTEFRMPRLLQAFADDGVSIDRIKDAMAAIGYSKNALHQLDRWESKRTTGRFGR